MMCVLVPLQTKEFKWLIFLFAFSSYSGKNLPWGIPPHGVKKNKFFKLFFSKSSKNKKKAFTKSEKVTISFFSENFNIFYDAIIYIYSFKYFYVFIFRIYTFQDMLFRMEFNALPALNILKNVNTSFIDWCKNLPFDDNIENNCF